eukprot:831461-Amphidinium_carterae.1
MKCLHKSTISSGAEDSRSTYPTEANKDAVRKTGFHTSGLSNNGCRYKSKGPLKPLRCHGNEGHQKYTSSMQNLSSANLSQQKM